MVRLKVKTINVSLRKLSRFQKTIDTDLRRKGTGPIREALNLWGVTYRKFLQKRYKKFSKGGGNWRKLAASTIAARKGNSTKILIDTGAMFEAFQPKFTNKPGQLNEAIPFGTRLGIGEGRHPTARMSMTKLVSIHNFGQGVPKRQVIVQPDQAARREMRRVMVRAITKLKSQ